MADKYGIPSGGDPYPGKVKHYKNNTKKLDAASLHEVIHKGGWPDGKDGKTRNTAVAVCLAESSGQPYIYNTYKKGHFGLFQVSRSAWPDLFALGSDRWTDPVTNAKYAYKIYQQQGWKAWEGYTSGRYKQFEKEAGGGVLEGGDTGGTGPDGFGDLLPDVPDWFGVLGDAWEAVTTPAFWMRVAYGLTGVVLVTGGLFLIVQNSSVAKSARATAKSAASALPTGKLASAAKGVAGK